MMEKRLYHLLNAQGISYITISHRPMLKAMHCKSLLILGDKDRNYEFRELQSREDLMRRLKKDSTISAKETVDTKSTEQRITELQDKRSERYNFISKQKDQAKERMRKAFRNVGMISNLVRILKGAMPKGYVSKLLTIFGGIALKALLADLSLFNIAGLFRALFTRDANLLYVVLPSTPTSLPPLTTTTTTTTQVPTHDRRCRDRSCRECSEFVHSIHTEQSSGRSVGDSDWKVHEEVCLNKRILQSEKH